MDTALIHSINTSTTAEGNEGRAVCGMVLPLLSRHVTPSSPSSFSYSYSGNMATKRRRTCRFCAPVGRQPESLLTSRPVHCSENLNVSPVVFVPLPRHHQPAIGAGLGVVASAPSDHDNTPCGAAAAAAASASASASCDREKELQRSPPPLRRPRRRRTGAGKGISVGGTSGNAIGSRSRMIRTAAAAVLGVLAATPTGVGAAMTEAQCEGTTLRGTEAELMESPRSDNSTEAAAAGLDLTVVASQTTFDRMVADRLAISQLDGRDIPFRNLWSDHIWIGTAEVTFPGAEALALFLEGTAPEFECMNQHYGLEFVKGDAGETFAKGTLTADKVLNWSLLGPDYVALEGVSSFTPTDVTSIPSTTFLVAAAERVESDDDDEDVLFHYFLAEAAEEIDPSLCPEPCEGEVVSYYWSIEEGEVHLLDVASVSADDSYPCWLDLFEAVRDGPPEGGIDSTLWYETMGCTEGLVENLVDDSKTSNASAASSGNSGSGGSSSSSSSSEGDSIGTVTVATAVLVPTALITLAVAVFGLLRHQKHRRAIKIQTTEEAWGEGLDGSSGGKGKKHDGVTHPRDHPPKGRFKLGGLVAQAPLVPANDADAAEGAAAAAWGGDKGFYVVKRKSFPPPQRASTDQSLDEEDGYGANGLGQGEAAEQAADVVILVDEDANVDVASDDTGGDDREGMIYPL